MVEERPSNAEIYAALAIVVQAERVLILMSNYEEHKMISSGFDALYSMCRNTNMIRHRIDGPLFLAAANISRLTARHYMSMKEDLANQQTYTYMLRDLRFILEGIVIRFNAYASWETTDEDV